MGYYAVFLGLYYHNDWAITKAIDADAYDESQTLTIKVPVSIPYMPDQADFERVSGEFSHEGELFRLVKQKYAQDTLTIVCVRDTEHEKIDRVLSEYAKTLTGRSTDHGSIKIMISFLKDFLPISFSVRSTSPGWSIDLIQNSGCKTFIPAFSASIIHPPEKA